LDEAFRWFRDHHVENMERMFAAVSDLYAEHWNDFFHFAIFESDEEPWEAAFERTHRRYLEALRLSDGARAVELACGRGGFSEYLAANSGADVLGLDISRSQLSHARKRKRANLAFVHHDIMRVDELGERFDAVVLMDADCYLPDKREAVARIARAMKPGGRFLLVAWCKQQGLNGLQEEMVLHPFMRFWGVPSLETPAGYRRHFKRAGLRIVEEEDLNAKTRRNWDFGYDSAIAAIRDFTVARAAKMLWKGLPLGTDGIRLVKEQFPAALYIKAGFDSGFLRYTYFLAEKE
jgi:cyclopropane fatty-acyl-phospholipid synthase-like methyltransferase